MEHNTTRKVLTVEEHNVTFGKKDLVELLDEELAGEGILVAPRITHLSVIVGDEEPVVVGPNRLLEMIRAAKDDIPEDAELVLAVRWRKTVATRAGAPAVGSRPASPYAAPVPHPAPSGAVCPSCQATPAVEGPTPDCEDENGCGMVRAVKGDMPIVQTQEPEGAARIGQGGGRRPGEPPPGRLVNRETGQVAFADRDGMPYGVHEDYSKR